MTLSLLRNVTLDDELDQPPELIFGLDVFLETFWELDRERIDLNRMIRPSEIDRWLEKHKVTDPEFIQALHYHVEKLDIAFMKLMREKQKRDEQDGVGNSGNRRKHV